MGKITQFKRYTIVITRAQSSTNLELNNSNILVLSTPKRKQKPSVPTPTQTTLSFQKASIPTVILESSPFNSETEMEPAQSPNTTVKRLSSFKSQIQQYSYQNSLNKTSAFSQVPKKRKLTRAKDSLCLEPKPFSSLNLHKSISKYDSAISVNLSDSDSENDNDTFREQKHLIDAEAETLRFFNKATLEQLVDQTGATAEEAQLIIDNRRYRSYELTETLFRKTKGLRVGLLNRYHDTVDGLAEIDSVIKKCEIITLNLTQTLAASGIIMDKKTGSVESVDQNLILKQPKLINPQFSLKDFQLEGITWLCALYNANASGILADEMGLGKTFQVIAMITKLKESGIPGPHLIICPSSTLDNWLNEFNKFSPNVTVKSYYGNQMDRRRMALKIEKYGVNFDVLLSTYNVATSNKTDRALLKRIPFKSLILDEGHMIKNCTSIRYTHLMQIKTFTDWYSSSKQLDRTS
ncbi:hypothetical protein BB560_005418, partial [Smittium megazygosporum]